MSRTYHQEKQEGYKALVFADSPYTVLVGNEVVSGDCTAGQITSNLPAIASFRGLSLTFIKSDNSANSLVLDGNGAETIAGQATVSLLSQWDAITLYAPPTGTDWLVKNFTQGASLVPTDTVEFQILDRSAADFANLASLALAEADATARTNSFSTIGYSRFAITIDVTTAGAPTTLFMAPRVSGKAAPAIGTTADWSYEAVDNIDRSTGISSTQVYQVNIPANGVRRFTRNFRTWGSFAMAVVWVNGANCRGRVYAQRFSS